jgi:hypothetical protein
MTIETGNGWVRQGKSGCLASNNLCYFSYGLLNLGLLSSFSLTMTSQLQTSDVTATLHVSLSTKKSVADSYFFIPLLSWSFTSSLFSYQFYSFIGCLRLYSRCAQRLAACIHTILGLREWAVELGTHVQSDVLGLRSVTPATGIGLASNLRSKRHHNCTGHHVVVTPTREDWVHINVTSGVGYRGKACHCYNLRKWQFNF